MYTPDEWHQAKTRADLLKSLLVYVAPDDVAITERRDFLIRVATRMLDDVGVTWRIEEE